MLLHICPASLLRRGALNDVTTTKEKARGSVFGQGRLCYKRDREFELSYFDMKVAFKTA